MERGQLPLISRKTGIGGEFQEYSRSHIHKEIINLGIRTEALLMGKVGVMWWIGVIIGILGILMKYNKIIIPGLTSFWMMTLAFGVLALNNLFRK